MAVRSRPVHVPQRQFRRARARRAKAAATALIDAPEEAPILAAIERTGWTPDADPDHPPPWRPCRGQSRAEAEIRADDHRPDRPKRRRFPASTRRSARATRSPSAPRRISVHRDARPHRRPCLLLLPGFGHRCSPADTLFALGCGRLLECKPPVMFDSLKQLAALPLETSGLLRPRIHAGQCPLRADRRPDQLGAEGARRRDRQAARRRQADAADDDRRSNWPPTRSCAGTIRRSARNLGMEKAADAEVFAEIRKRKDVF